MIALLSSSVGIAKETVNYHFREWIFARQRYWGEPVPVVHGEDGKIHVLDDSELPLILPELEDYKGKNGQAPLENATEWKMYDKNGIKGKRETSTMPGSAGSSWYFLRYIDPDNDEKKAPKKSLDEMTDGFRFGQDIDTDLWYNELEDGLRAIAHAQSFQNLQPYKIIVDNDQISLIGLPDDMTSEADRLLNYGIVMFNFYAVMWAIRPTAPRWSFEPVTDRDLGLPADVTYVAKCGL